MYLMCIIVAIATLSSNVAGQLADWTTVQTAGFINFAASDRPDMWTMSAEYRVELVCTDRAGLITETAVDPSAITVVNTPAFGIRTWAIQKSLLPPRPRGQKRLLRVINIWTWVDDAGQVHRNRDCAWIPAP